MGEWASARIAPDRYAVKFNFELDMQNNLIGVVRGTSGDVIGGNPSFVRLFGDEAGNTQYRAPRLAPSGLELYVRIEMLATGGTRIGRSVRTATTDLWTTPIPIAINTVLSSGVLPSPPTTTTPRHMVIMNGVQTMIEIREASLGSWHVERTQAIASFSTAMSETVAFLGEAHLTEDGRRLVFRGQITSQPVGAFYVERASLDDAFTGSATRLPTMGSVSQPFFTSDCKYMLYTRESEGFVYRVVYQ